MSSVAELAALREANCRLRNKLLEIAKECASCGGTGCATPYADRPDIVLPCPGCEDIRAILE